MILCIDIGNSQIFFGVFEQQQLLFTFRHDSQVNDTSDQFGVFLQTILTEKKIARGAISAVAICSVVPQIDYSMRAACIKYLEIQPLVLRAGVKTGLKINYRDPNQVGADRIANAVAASGQFPNKNILVMNFGTATTLCAISANKQYLGGVILPGLKLAMNTLQRDTAKLSPVEIIKPDFLIGRSTEMCIQSGLYHSQLATLRYLSQQITTDIFAGEQPITIGTGGFSHLFEQTGLFAHHQPDLVLHGLRLVLAMN